MHRESFNRNWSVSPLTTLFEGFRSHTGGGRKVHLPQDLLRHEQRVPSGTSHTGYYPSSAMELTKTFHVDSTPERRRTFLEFDGVYRDATVYVNGDFAGQRANGYVRFHVDIEPFLKPGEQNEVKVVARTHEDSRWYTGLGIYREVSLLTSGLVHVAVDGIKVTTPDVNENEAVIAVAIPVVNDGSPRTTVSVHTRILDPEGREIAEDRAPVTVLPGSTETLRQRMVLVHPSRWSVESPKLYRVEVTLLQGETVLDSERATFGIRTLQVDARNGLRINGHVVKLRGACIHHDNGILGSAAIQRSEERKIELLKAAGFNAIRSSHNPLSSHMLDACDRLGMLVMDEAFDVWTVAKTAHDYSLDFVQWFERDIDAMVHKDFNHPSVIFYSIGNEIPETGSAAGARWGRRIAERIRALDPTRFVTNGINAMVSVMTELKAIQSSGGTMPVPKSAPGQNINDSAAQMNRLSVTPFASERTAESFAVLDVAGINYGDARYGLDAEMYPNRVIVGTETFPAQIAKNWKLVQTLDHVIGDFTWTGWDYLGEAGIGRPFHNDGDQGLAAPYPWRSAGSGDIDITGRRRPVSYYREIVFGLRQDPYMAVVRPQEHGTKPSRSPWAWSDSIASWTWDLPLDTDMKVEVYSAAPEVELFLNGSSIGRMPAGTENDFRAIFDVPWQPGTLSAVDVGSSSGRCDLRTAADQLQLVGRCDRNVLQADDADLAHIDITLEDNMGTITTQNPAVVKVTVLGAGVLEALGSADPAPSVSPSGGGVSAFEGHVLAIVRPLEPGQITVHVSAEGFTPIELTLNAVEGPCGDRSSETDRVPISAAVGEV